MSSTVDVCGSCRTTCPKCHSETNSSHPIWVCSDCKRQFKSKCSVCGGTKKSGSKAVGAGRVCNSCFKMNTCTFCGKHN